MKAVRHILISILLSQITWAVCAQSVNIQTVHAEPTRSAQKPNCLEPDQLRATDQAWEKALRVSDVEWLTKHLAEDFVWVHNHASSVDSKSSLISRAKDPNAGATGHPLARTSRDVQILTLGNTAVVTGFTTVDRGTSSKTYNFMRTYAEVDGVCLLLANHTMGIPETTD